MIPARLDAPAATRALQQIAEQNGDLADLFLERREEIELPPEDEAPGFRVRREAGLSVRLLRDGRSWLASTDRIDAEAFADAARRVTRVQPRTSAPRPSIEDAGWEESPRAPELSAFPTAVLRAARSLGPAPPVRLRVRRFRRAVQIVGSQLASGIENETFYSVEASGDDLRHGTLLARLGETEAEEVARSIRRRAEAREHPLETPEVVPLVLGASAAAVLLHEAVAHALEVDVLASGGHPETAIGVRVASERLDVFDDPAQAPAPVRRAADDEGYPVSRRCLLRRGVVEQPLCDLAWSRRSELFVPGAGRRGSRHHAPEARSHHLSLVPGEASRAELFEGAEGGLYLPEIERGRLDPRAAIVHLRFPWARRIENGTPGRLVGPLGLRVPLRRLLGAIVAVGADERSGGAGWCAKGGVRLPVWATSPALGLEGLEVTP